MTDEKPEPARKLRVTLGHQVKMKVIEWWEDCWIALGALTLLAGREGLGKSTIACYWAAVETLRGNYVIYLHSEDSREHTVVPRLLAAGADLSKVIFVDVETEFTTEGNVILPYDLDELDALIAEYGVTFIVLDAATSAMSANLSGKDDRDVRRFLEPLSQLAAKHNIVILGLVHFGKRDGADSGKLILGSIAWSQVARSVLSVALDPDSGNIVVTNTKGNLAPKTRSVEARIRSTAISIDGQPTEIGVLEWLGETTADARDYLSGETGESNRDVDDWLKGFLGEGPQKATEIFSAADANGFSKDQVKRAKKRIGAVADRPQNPGPWFWELPTIIDSEVVEPSTEQGAPSTGQGVDVLPALPVLPVRSEGVEQGAEVGREQSALHDSLLTPCTNSDGDVVTSDGDVIPRRVWDKTVDEFIAGSTAPRPTTCSVCNIALPATATTDVCEECSDPARQLPEPPVERQLHVVHDGRAKRGEVHICPYCDEALIYRDDISDGYHTSSSKCVRAHRKLGA